MSNRRSFRKKKKRGTHKWPYFLGGALCGVLELFIFHPIDTIAKRKMASTKDISGNLYAGLLFGIGYKVLQRIYRFACQPLLGDYLWRNYRNRYSKDMTNSVAGTLVACCETFLLPLDIMKIRLQCDNNNENYINNYGYYNGMLITMIRNTPGNFALFATNRWVYTYLFRVSGPRQATHSQILCTSVIAGAACICVSSPFDVIKTRMQANPDQNHSIINIAKSIWKNEGIRGYFSGITYKLILIPPKLIFSFTVAQYIIGKFQEIDYDMTMRSFLKEYNKYQFYKNIFNQNRKEIVINAINNVELADIILEYVYAMEIDGNENVLKTNCNQEYVYDCGVISRVYNVRLNYVRHYIKNYRDT